MANKIFFFFIHTDLAQLSLEEDYKKSYNGVSNFQQKVKMCYYAEIEKIHKQIVILLIIMMNNNNHVTTISFHCVAHRAVPNNYFSND